MGRRVVAVRTVRSSPEQIVKYRYYGLRVPDLLRTEPQNETYRKLRVHVTAFGERPRFLPQRNRQRGEDSKIGGTDFKYMGREL